MDEQAETLTSGMDMTDTQVEDGAALAKRRIVPRLQSNGSKFVQRPLVKVHIA